MKVYFMGSPRGKKEHKSKYESIFNEIEVLEHDNVTDFLIDVDVEKFYLSDIKNFYKHTMNDLKVADVLEELGLDRDLASRHCEISKKQLLDMCDFSIEIPQFGIKQSLNVAVAYGITIFELRKTYDRIQT